MCGIIAINGAGNLEETVIHDALNKLSHRGDVEPEHVYIDDCFLGMSRLTIVDRDNATQPMSNEDDSLYIVFNGEIYNYDQLRVQLSDHEFKTESDTEVILHGYEEWGSDVVDQLDGQFAFAIYDRKTKSLFAARDPFGIKPLYFLNLDDGATAFASEMKALTDFDSTGIHRFKPGTYLKGSEFSEYFQIKDSEYETDIEKIKKEIKQRFEDAVEKRVQTDLPIAVLLSGGIDSSLVLKYAMKHHPAVTAFSIGKDDSEDIVYAKSIAEDLGVNLVTVDPTDIDKAMAERLEEIIYIGEAFEPNHINSMPLCYAIAEAIHDAGIKVALAGEGADELFGGYDEFRAIRDKKQLQGKLVHYLGLLNRTQLHRVDRMFMAHQVEVRVPFLDRTFAEHAMTIDPFLKILYGIPKWILREAFRGELPDYIIDRAKNPFGVGARLPVNTGDYDAFAHLAEQMSDEEFARVREMFDNYALLTKTEAMCFQLYNKHFPNTPFNRVRFGMLPR